MEEMKIEKIFYYQFVPIWDEYSIDGECYQGTINFTFTYSCFCFSKTFSYLSFLQNNLIVI